MDSSISVYTSVLVALFADGAQKPWKTLKDLAHQAQIVSEIQDGERKPAKKRKTIERIRQKKEEEFKRNEEITLAIEFQEICTSSSLNETPLWQRCSRYRFWIHSVQSLQPKRMNWTIFINSGAYRRVCNCSNHVTWRCRHLKRYTHIIKAGNSSYEAHFGIEGDHHLRTPYSAGDYSSHSRGPEGPWRTSRNKTTNCCSHWYVPHRCLGLAMFIRALWLSALKTSRAAWEMHQAAIRQSQKTDDWESQSSILRVQGLLKHGCNYMKACP